MRDAVGVQDQLPKTGDLRPRPPSPLARRAVRGLALVWVLVTLGLWAGQIILGGGLHPVYGPLLGCFAGSLTGLAASWLWRWAGQPRLTGEQQHSLAAALREEDRVGDHPRRELARPIRRSRPAPPETPAGLRICAVPYAHAQHNLEVSAFGTMLLSALLLFTVAAGTPSGAWDAVYLGLVVVVDTVAGTVLWWTQAAQHAATRWSSVMAAQHRT